MEVKNWNRQTMAAVKRTLDRYYNATMFMILVGIFAAYGPLDRLARKLTVTQVYLLGILIVMVILAVVLAAPVIRQTLAIGLVSMLWLVRTVALAPWFMLLHGICNTPEWFHREFKRFKKVVQLMLYLQSTGAGVFGTKDILPQKDSE